MNAKSSDFTNIDKSTKHLNFNILDAVKGLTILWIAWYHIDQLILLKNPDIFSLRTLATLGYAGVNVFIILSGIGLSLSQSKITDSPENYWHKFSWSKFFTRRFLRIYPLYIFCHILFFITGILVGKYAEMPLDEGFLLSITGLRVFFPKYFWYGPDAFWFVGLIIQLYLLFPILFWILLKTGKQKFLIITLAICVISRFITINSEHSYEFMLGLATNRLAEFSLGIVIGYDTKLNNEFSITHIYLKNKCLWIIFGLSILIGVLINWQPLSLVKIACNDLILGVIGFSGLSIISLIVNLIPKIYYSLCFIGTISYSLYLLHSPPIRPAFSAFKSFGIPHYWLITILYLLIMTVLSFGLTKLESRMLSRKRKV
jgi:peptidoglycan/LPS O-acetylase OafA/YrhL